jgi:hypothetical protein
MSASGATISDNVGGSITVSGAAAAAFTLTVGDNKGNGTTPQQMAGGTEIRVETSNGTIVGPNSFIFACSNFDGPANVTFIAQGNTTPDTGVITVEVESPSGIITTHAISFTD